MYTERRQIEQSLRQRLENARAAYRRATDESIRLMGISEDTSDLGNPARVDGTHAMSKALLIERQASGDYRKALKVFYDFIVYGKRPTDLDR